MTAKTNRRGQKAAAGPWWRQKRHRNTVWVATLAAALLALGAFVFIDRGDGGSNGAITSRFQSIYQFQTADLHALTFDPVNPGRLVFGHHGGVMASKDGGRNWSKLVERQNFDGMNLVFDPADSSTLYLAGHNVFSRSEDGGSSWESVSHNLPGRDLHAFGASAREGRFYAFAVGGGIFASEGGASNWTPFWPNAPQGTNSIVELKDGTLLVGATDSGILRSDDGGTSWEESRSGIEIGVIFSIKADANSEKVYAGTSNGLYASTDGGRSWTPTTLDDAQIVTVGVNPNEGDDVMAIDGGGRLYHSTDGGSTWRS